jgi:hypothetical protein
MADLLFVTWTAVATSRLPSPSPASWCVAATPSASSGHPVQRDPLTAAGFEVEPAVHARSFTAADGVAPVTMVRTFGDRGSAATRWPPSPAGLPTWSSSTACCSARWRSCAVTGTGLGAPYVLLEHLYDAFFRGPACADRSGSACGCTGLRLGASLRAARRRRGHPARARPGRGRRPPAARRTWAGGDGDPRLRRPAVLVSLSTFGFPA